MLDDDFVSRGRSLERYRLIAVGRERGEEAQKTRRKKELLVRMRNRTAVVVSFVSAFVSIFCDRAAAYNVLMATMGGTKSHTIPFVALGISLKTRGHNVTLLSAFPGPAASNGLQEFVPPIFQVIRTPIFFFTPFVSYTNSFRDSNLLFGQGGQESSVFSIKTDRKFFARGGGET